MATVTNIEIMHKELETSWSRKLAEFEDRLMAAATMPGNPSLTQLSSDFHIFKELVTSMLSLLRQQVGEIHKTIDNIDMRQRQKILLFNGISENAENDVETEVVRVVQNNLGIALSGSSFKRCHRLGVSVEGRVRPVLVHFNNHKTKAEIWKAKSKLKGTSVTIAEFLTRPRQFIYKRAREVFGMKQVWTLDGVIHVKIPKAGRFKVVSEDELHSLIAKFPVVDPNDGEKTVEAAAASIPQQEARRKQVTGVAPDESKRPRRPATRK